MHDNGCIMHMFCMVKGRKETRASVCTYIPLYITKHDHFKDTRGGKANVIAESIMEHYPASPTKSGPGPGALKGWNYKTPAAATASAERGSLKSQQTTGEVSLEQQTCMQCRAASFLFLSGSHKREGDKFDTTVTLPKLTPNENALEFAEPHCCTGQPVLLLPYTAHTERERHTHT